MVRLAISLAGAGLCGVATFGSWKSVVGACIVEAIGIALIIIGYSLPNDQVDAPSGARSAE